MNSIRPRLGWRQDLEDHDALAAEAVAFRITRADFEAPEEIDPRAWMQIENQGQMGSCAGHARSTVMEYCNWIDTRGQVIQLSRMYAYLTAQMESGISGDSGATISGAMQAAKRRGCCLETTFPYPSRYTPTIPQAAHDEAKDHKLRNYAMLSNYEDCFNFLASGVGGIEIGISWTSSLANNRTGVIESSSGQTYGGHALAIIGYTKRKDRQGRQYLLMFNSHGRQWGANGVAEIAPTLFDRWGQDRYSEMIGASDLEEFAPRKVDWTKGALV